jgi:hypothetical protein
VLDPAGIAISTDPGEETAPTVAFDGTNYLVAWVMSDYSMHGTRVSPAGIVLDRPGVRLSNGPHSQLHPPALAFDGTNYLLVSATEFFAKTVYGVRVSRELVVIDEPAIVVSTAANSQTDPAVGFDGTNYLVVWSDNRFSGGGTLFGARVSRNGTILDGDGFSIPGETDPAIAFDGTNFLVVSLVQDAPGGPLLQAARVGPDGAVLDPDGLGIAFSAAQPAVAFDGVNFVVVWFHSPDDCACPPTQRAIEGALVSPSGAVSRSGTQIAPDVPFWADPTIASDGTNTLVAWVDDRNGPDASDIYGTRVNRNLDVLDGAGIPISTAAGVQNEPAAAFDGTRYLVVWSDGRTIEDVEGSFDIYGARVSRSGVVRDPDGIPISTAPWWETDPSVAANGRFLVVWSDRRPGSNGDVYGARVGGSGRVFDPEGVPIAASSTLEEQAAVTAGPGRRFGVVYTRYAPEAPYRSDRAFLRTVAPK